MSIDRRYMRELEMLYHPGFIPQSLRYPKWLHCLFFSSDMIICFKESLWIHIPYFFTTWHSRFWLNHLFLTVLICKIHTIVGLFLRIHLPFELTERLIGIAEFSNPLQVSQDSLDCDQLFCSQTLVSHWTPDTSVPLTTAKLTNPQIILSTGRTSRAYHNNLVASMNMSRKTIV